VVAVIAASQTSAGSLTSYQLKLAANLNSDVFSQNQLSCFTCNFNIEINYPM
jgi:hypothetical protein